MLFKVLDGYEPTNGGKGRYPGVGRWTRHLNPNQLYLCRYGYHLAEDVRVLNWLGPSLFEAEACPDHSPIRQSNKLVTCRVRLTHRFDTWNPRTARLFAADCAERVVHLTGPDERSVNAIRVARAYANGQATRQDLDAARNAAWAAREEAGAAHDAARAARDAHAAHAAARAVAWAAREEAWAAAGAAAWAAARDAWAAWDAAHAAARAAAWADERDWQYTRLLHYLNGDTE